MKQLFSKLLVTFLLTSAVVLSWSEYFFYRWRAIWCRKKSLFKTFLPIEIFFFNFFFFLPIDVMTLKRRDSLSEGKKYKCMWIGNLTVYCRFSTEKKAPVWFSLFPFGIPLENGIFFLEKIIFLWMGLTFLNSPKNNVQIWF